MKKILIMISLLIVAISLASCTKKDEYFTVQDLEKFGLDDLTVPTNASDFYNQSTNKMLLCYMNVKTDNDVRNFVLEILDMFDSNRYQMYGYAKADDMFKKERKIYLSKDINDYQINTNNYSKDSVSFNSYEFYYLLEDQEKTMFILTITSYTVDNPNYLSGYNLVVSVAKKNASKYSIITE